MKIHFLREGHANNSSSSHSIVVIPKNKKIHDSYDSDGYGWDFFTLRSRSAKISYLLSMLQTNVLGYIRIENPFGYGHEASRKYIDNVTNEIIEFLLQEMNPIFKDVMPEYLTALGFLCNVSGVDHQSCVTIPKIRGKYNELDLEFYKSFCEEVLKEEVTILGGNDNTDDSHPLLNANLTHWHTFYRFLCDKEQNSLFSSQDPVTKVWTVQYKNSGTIMRFSFDKDIDAYNIKAGIPYLVDISLTNRCSHGCEYCYRDATPDGKKEEKETFKYYSLAKVLQNAGINEVVLGGGSPDEIKDIIDIASYFKDKMLVGMTTKNYSLYKMKDFKYLLGNLSSLAISCNSMEELEEAIILHKKIEETEIPIDISVQCILGLQIPKQFISFLNKAYKTFYNVTMLGYKNVGRGASVNPQFEKNMDWIDWLKSENGRRIGIDSVIATQYEKELLEIGVDNYRLIGREGMNTCFYDAVNKKLFPSSFSDHPGIDFDYCSRKTDEEKAKEFLDAFSRF